MFPYVRLNHKYFRCVSLFPGPDGLSDAEQGQAGAGVTAPQHTQASYGTYNPPPMGGEAAVGGTGAKPNTGPAVVIAMPPPEAAASSSSPVIVPPTPPNQPRPVTASTPAPDTQADGGID